MNLEKLEEETKRLEREVENSQTNWEDFLRRGFLFLAYQIVIGLVLGYFFPQSRYVIILLIISSLLWELWDGAKTWMKLHEAQKTLGTWKQTVNLANQNVE